MKPYDLPVLDGELVAVDDLLTAGTAVVPAPTPPPAPIAAVCVCGKAPTHFAHGLMPGRRRPFLCHEVRAIRERVEADLNRPMARLDRVRDRLIGGAR